MKRFKTVKTSLFTLILALIAIGTIAVAAVMKKDVQENASKHEVTKTWYFVGTDPLNPSHYTLSVQPCGGLAETICSIEAEDDADMPLLTEEREDDIQEILDAIEDKEELVTNSTVLSFRSL